MNRCCPHTCVVKISVSKSCFGSGCVSICIVPVPYPTVDFQEKGDFFLVSPTPIENVLCTTIQYLPPKSKPPCLFFPSERRPCRSRSVRVLPIRLMFRMSPDSTERLGDEVGPRKDATVLHATPNRDGPLGGQPNATS